MDNPNVDARIMKARLIGRIKRTQTVESFRFMPEAKYFFSPGQFLQLIFDKERPENGQLNKYLSFSSSPTKEYIEVTKRLSGSDFSRRMDRLKTNDEIVFKGPLGSCIFRDEYAKIGFLIGGIGITPVISIVEYVAEKDLDTDILLLYSNRSEEEIAFKKELDSWQETHRNIQVVYTVTDCKPQDIRCIYGRIDKSLFLNSMDSLQERKFFIFGPPKMVEAMKNICIDTGCAKENIRTEMFIGY